MPFIISRPNTAINVSNCGSLKDCQGTKSAYRVIFVVNWLQFVWCIVLSFRSYSVIVIARKWYSLIIIFRVEGKSLCLSAL